MGRKRGRATAFATCGEAAAARGTSGYCPFCHCFWEGARTRGVGRYSGVTAPLPNTQIAASGQTLTPRDSTTHPEEGARDLGERISHFCHSPGHFCIQRDRDRKRERHRGGRVSLVAVATSTWDQSSHCAVPVAEWAPARECSL